MSSTTNRYNLQIFDWSTDTTRSFIDGLAGLTDSNMQKLEDVIGDIEDIVTSSIQLERVEITSGVDLNSLNDINKVYVSTNDSIARQCTNIPKSTINSFELRTYKTTYSQDSKYFMQMLKTYTNELWIRGCNVDVWTEWKQIATNDDIETINNNIDNINTNIDNINDDITTRINNSIDEINDTINEINTDINSSIDTINTNLTRATERIDTNANNIATNITNITNLTNKLTDYPTLEYLEEVKTDLENEIANIHIPTTLPASDVYDWAKASTKPTYTASEVGALASNGTAVNASKVSNALTLQIGGTTKNTFNGSSAQTFNIPNASTSAPGVMTSAMVTKLDGIATGATKNVVDTAMSSTSTNAVQNKVIYAYIQEQIQNALGEMNMVKSVQRGVTTIESGDSSCDIRITAVNVNKAMVNYLGFTGEANDSSSDHRYRGYIRLSDSTTVTISRGRGDSDYKYSWEVIEFN